MSNKDSTGFSCRPSFLLLGSLTGGGAGWTTGRKGNQINDFIKEEFVQPRRAFRWPCITLHLGTSAS
jgi:hypothetical protein